MRELQKGEVVAGLVVKDRIGNGGMGDVYLVHDSQLAVDRALKLISLTGPGFNGSKAEVIEYRERFMREARTLARLRHPNIIAVQATGEHDGDPFLVMSYFPSKDARHWLHEDRPSLERIRQVALQAARALAYAHEQRVLHRDIKLGNLLVGARDEAMLIDFGLAKSAADSDLTRTGRSMGTFSYLAPEYVKASTIGKPKHTVATDLWAFGCLLYALTCGEPAFRDKNEIKLLRLIAKAQFTPVKTRAPLVPDEWATLIHQLLEPDPARRTPSAAELLARLERVSLRAPGPQGVAPVPPVDDDSLAVAPVAAGAGAPLEHNVADDAPVEEIDIEDDDVVADGHAAGREESIFDHAENAPTTTAEVTSPSVILPQPSFQQPPQRETSARGSARKKLIVPIAAAVAVLVVGGALIVWTSQMSANHRKATTYVDPDELQRKQRATTELNDLAREKGKRASTEHVDIAPAPAVPMFAVPLPERAAEPPAAEKTPYRGRPRQGTAAAVPTVSAERNPWLERYGTRASYNTSSGGNPPVTSASAPGTAAVAGIKVPVRVGDAIASAPLGPVIAVVQSTTRLGGLELPRGAELHGRVTGAEGPRVLVDFTFAIVNGRNVQLKGTALGSDGRAGVPGAKNIGGASDVGAGAAGGGAQAVLDAAVALVDNDIAGGVLRGATAPIVNKTSRFNTEEDLVVAARGAKFFVYVESVL